MYLLHSVLKLMLEVIFLWGNYVLQVQQSQTYNLIGTWFVPEKWVCPTTTPHEAGNWYSELFFDDNQACSQQSHGVTCWMDKPNEKTFFLKYMITMDCICILVTVFEIIEMLFTETK